MYIIDSLAPKKKNQSKTIELFAIHFMFYFDKTIITIVHKNK